MMSKANLPNDSWHYQMQVQKTYGDPDEGNKTIELDLDKFKTEKCTIQAKHNPKHWKYYHSLKDRRRAGVTYSTDLCRFAETDKCIKGDKCPLSHSNVERLYHINKYKTKFWDTFGHDTFKCEYGEFCSFAHVLSEIKVDLIHKLHKDANFYMYYFKTEWCPFRKDHHKADCVYAHNWQDFRRKPQLFNYHNTKCENWKSARYITKYSEGWRDMENCMQSHGWKEEYYHPMSYKVYPCKEKKCMKNSKLECPFYHDRSERRIVGNDSANQLSLRKHASYNPNHISMPIYNTPPLNHSISNNMDG